MSYILPYPLSLSLVGHEWLLRVSNFSEIFQTDRGVASGECRGVTTILS